MTPESIRTRRAGDAVYKARLHAYEAKWRALNRDQERERQRSISESNKNAVVNVLTNGEGTCRWCGQGDIDVLVIDHIEDNGAEHRRENGGRCFSGDRFYRWIIRNDYPPGFQVLCANCNLKKETLRRRSMRRQEACTDTLDMAVTVDY